MDIRDDRIINTQDQPIQKITKPKKWISITRMESHNLYNVDFGLGLDIYFKLAAI